MGSIGILAANGIYGEVSPAMATEASGSDAEKGLAPSNRCEILFPNVENVKLDEMIMRVVALALKELEDD